MGSNTPADHERLRRIETVTDASLSRLDSQTLLIELLDRVRELLDADTVAVLLLDPSSQELVSIAARGLEEQVREGVRIPLGKGFAGRVAADHRPVIVERLDETEIVNPLLREKGICSLLGVPLLAEGTVTGVIHVGTFVHRRFTDDDIEVLQLAADRVAFTTRAQLSEVDRAAALALQRSLLPDRLPSIPGLEFAARYHTGAGGVGGDWYDVFRMPSGALCIVIGDVVGRGLHAAVVMGRLRSALRAYALHTEDPAEILAKLDQKVQHFEPDMMATVLCAVIDPSAERMVVSCAGHPAPVFVLPNAASAFLADLPVDLPMGVSLDDKRRSTTIDIPVGTVMCLYTDGLVERRTITLDASLELLRGAVHAGCSVEDCTADSVCEAVMAELIGDGPTDDDIALITCRLTERHPLEGGTG
ncbi:MAG TPA: GAF domain-containing SpoIIE family protein phosphatase [Actinopolymorphaceae bacterium]